MTEMEARALERARTVEERVYLNRDGDNQFLAAFKGLNCLGWADPDGEFTRLVQGETLSTARGW